MYSPSYLLVKARYGGSNFSDNDFDTNVFPNCPVSYGFNNGIGGGDYYFWSSIIRRKILEVFGETEVRSWDDLEAEEEIDRKAIRGEVGDYFMQNANYTVKPGHEWDFLDLTYYSESTDPVHCWIKRCIEEHRERELEASMRMAISEYRDIRMQLEAYISNFNLIHSEEWNERAYRTMASTRKRPTAGMMVHRLLRQPNRIRSRIWFPAFYAKTVEDIYEYKFVSEPLVKYWPSFTLRDV